MHEGETQEVIQIIPDYCVIPGMDSQQDSLTSVTPSEAQLLVDMLSHFFLSKMETDIGNAIKEKLDALSKPKIQQAGQNKRQVLEFTLPNKIKKSLQKIISICFEAMKPEKSKADWMVFPEANALRARFPKYMEYRNTLKEKDILKDLEIVEETIEELRNLIKEKWMKEIGIEELEISNDSLELLHQLMISSKSKKVIFPEFVFNDGERVERARIKQFLKLAQEVNQRIDRSSTKVIREITDNPLNMNGVTVLMTLFMHFNDQERSGILLADGVNLAAEPMEKLIEISQSLALFEDIGKVAISCSSLMESPVWFFHNMIFQLRVSKY